MTPRNESEQETVVTEIAHAHKLSDEEHELLHRSGVPHIHGSFEGETAHAHDNLLLRTIGIDIGSSTSHLMFGEVHLRRLSRDFSSKYVVVDRRTVWRSDVILTPYLESGLIDAQALRAFVSSCYEGAAVTEESLDTGLVILTGDALARPNSRAISAEFADDSGKFICALAGHHREARMAAAGSGSEELSAAQECVVLNLDVGGGTTKLAMIRSGVTESTAAVAIGARTLRLDDERHVVHLAAETEGIAASVGLRVRVGDLLSVEHETLLAEAMVDVVVRAAQARPLRSGDPTLLVTEPLDVGQEPDVVTFSGGVSEFVYGREERSFNDLGRPLGNAFRSAARSGRLGGRLLEPAQGIRATAIGLSQFSVQVSGKTLHLPHSEALPIRNVPVIGPVRCGDTTDASTLAERLAAATSTVDFIEDRLAVALNWHGETNYGRLRAVADALAEFVGTTRLKRDIEHLVVVLDSDLAASLGRLLTQEVSPRLDAICVDSIDLENCDYLDIGEPVGAALLTPVIMKSMLFA